MKNNFLEKLKEFDFLIEDKEKRLTELNSDLNEKQILLEDLKSQIDNYDNNRKVGTNDADEVILPKYADFEDGNVFSGYKTIKEKFNFDITTIIKQFIKKNADTSRNDYDTYRRVRDYFQYDIVYRLSNYQSSEQYEIVSELLSDSDKSYLTNILKKQKFNIKRFVNDLDELIIKTNPVINIFVGEKNVNYDYIDSRIKTSYDESITEGFKIFYKGVIYDYSI